MSDPFDVLGLAADTDLTDDDVRSAWRRVAAATHPDRTDGGDPAAFAAAAAAYTVLRTAAGRREVAADRRERASGQMPGDPVPAQNTPLAALAAHAARHIRHGRPVRLAARLGATVAVGALAVAAVGWQPASAAIITGALTWLLLTGHRDLAPRRAGRSHGQGFAAGQETKQRLQ
jgi:curved DNA-binding protein CbpA